jgi:drug/metabolite transporter (DMT)-like permease
MGCVNSLLKKCNDNPLGMVAFSSLGFSLQSLLVKYLSIAKFPSFQIIVARGFGQFVGVTCVLLSQGTPFKEWLGTSKTQAVTLFSRGFFGFFGMAFFFIALRKTTLANVQVTQQTVTVWTAILSRIFLGEQWYYPEMVTTVFVAAGVCLIFRPAFIFGEEESDDGPDDSATTSQSSQSASEPLSQHSVGMIFALCGSVSSAIAYVLIRTLGTTVKVPWPTVMLAQVYLFIFSHSF